MKKITYIISELNIGGAEKLLITLAGGMKNLYDIEVIYFTGNAPLLPLYEKVGIPVKKIEMTGRFSFSAYRKLIKHLKDRKPDIVHTHLYRADIYGVFAAKKARVPIIISTKHNTDDFRKEGGFWIWMDRKSMKKCTINVAVSEAVRKFIEKYENVNTDDWNVIRNGIDIQEVQRDYEKTPSKEELLQKYGLEIGLPTVSTIGRLAKQKGQIYLIKAFEKIRITGTKINMIIAGDGPERNNLQSYIHRKKLDKFIKLVGFVPDITEVLKATDVFVYPSVWEGLGIAILEAQAVNIPVIASNVDGIREIIENGKTGLLFPPENAGEIALAIQKLIRDENLCINIIDKAREKLFEQFTLEKFLQNHHELYQKAGGSKSCKK